MGRKEAGNTPDESASSGIPPEERTKPRADRASRADQVMYIGPTLMQPVHLRHRAVFVGGIPEYARKLAAQDPELAACFVPVVLAGKALRELEGYPSAAPGEHSRRFLGVRKRYQKEVK